MATSATVGVNVTSAPSFTVALALTGSSAIPAGSTRALTATVTGGGLIDRVSVYYDGNTLVGTDTTAPYNFLFTAPNTVGTHLLTAVATDVNGQEATSTPVQISLSGTIGSAPLAAIVTPANGSFIGVNAVTPITGTASDVDGSISSVQVFVNGTSIGNATVSGPTWSINWTPTVSGIASITAIATDNSGNAVAAPAVGVSVTDSSSPSIALSFAPGPAPSPILTMPSGAVRNVLATVAPSTGRAIVRVEFFVDGTKVGEDTSLPYSYRYVAPPLGDGEQSRTFVLSARATDNAGAARDTLTSILVVTPIGQPPTVSLLTPTNNAAVVPNAAVSLAATAVANGGTVASVQFFVNGSPALVNSGNPVIIPPATSYTSTFTPTAPGTYTIDAIATDDRGNTRVSTSATITAAFATPTVTITTPNPNATARATPNVPLNLAATATVQTGAGAAVLLVEFLLDGQQIGADTSPPYTFSWTPTVAQLGQHVLTARVTDTNSQTATSVPVNVNVATLVGTPPTISITQPALGGGVGQAGNLQSLSTVNFVANASSPATGVTITSVEFFLNDVSIGTGSREQATNLYRLAYDFQRFDFSTAPSVLDPNTGSLRYTPIPLYAIARDSNNNQTVTNPINLTVNPSTSSPPSIQLLALSPTTLTQGQQFFILPNFADADGTVTQLQLFVNGTLNTALGNPQQNQLITYNANTAGRFNLYVVAADDTGNTVVSTPSIVVNVTAVNAPVTEITRPADDTTATTVNAPVFLEGTAVNSSTTQVPNMQFIATASGGARTTINGTRVGTTNTFRAIWTPTAADTYTVTTQATVGTAQGTSTTSRRVTVANLVGLAPTVSINTPGSATTASTVNFTATAADSDGSVVEVEFFLNRDSIGQAVRDPSASTWRVTASFAGIPPGTAEVVARARDSSGNVAASTTNTVTVTAASSIAPSVTVNPSTVNAAFNRQVQLQSNARDADGTITSVQYFSNATSLGTSGNAGTNYQVNWTPNASGTFNVWALATDNTGNTTVASTIQVLVRRNNPVLEDAAFVLQTYQDIANTTTINPLVFDDIVARLGSGALTRSDVVVSLVDQPGFTAPVQLLAAYYVLMGQWPTPSNYTTLLATARGSLSNAVGQIIGSNEYFAKYGVVPTVALLNSPTSVLPADTYIARLWQAAGLGSPSAQANVAFRSNNTLTATLGRGYNSIGLNQALAEFITNTNSTNTALYNRARAAALYYQLDRPPVTVTVDQITARVTELVALADNKAIADAALKDLLYNYRYVTITKHPESLVVSARSGALFSVEAQGAPPLAYQWLLNGAPLSGATNALLSLTNVDTTRVGTYTAVVTSSAGSATSDPATLTLSTTPTRLANISTRGVTAGGDNVLIGGFVVSGTAGQSRQMLIRVVGPTLSGPPFNVTGTLGNPRLEVYANNNPTPVLTNDDWGSQAGGAAQVQQVQQAVTRAGAFAFAGPNSNDAAVVAALPPGLYTVQAKGPAANAGASGVVLIEVYDVTQGGPAGPKASNVSTRGNVGTGTNILIAGFVVNGTASRRMLIRGVGPTLANLRVPGVLADPRLTLIDQASGRTIRTNDDWASGDDAAIIAQAATAAGAFPLANGSKDAAMIVMLPPGAYTVQLSGANNGTGVAIVEVYDVDP
ncbi:beta strand repeat-containing protein [Horticoccus sp. 23ND18S-11]|uniref:beta strand repeat-containing protein n=1 Tax=Horticoccus sp. 23ND18S-11 TaxID=3391832 RepID=UPI0039C9A339